MPAIPELSPMLLRRASRADRAALRVALDGARGEPMPTVFVSRHGELSRSFELLDALERREVFSPTVFSLSVHNTAAGLYSLGRRDRSPTTSIAAAKDGLPIGVVEACGLLARHPRVLLVVYDDHVPAALGRVPDEATPDDDAWVAISLVLERNRQPELTLELSAAEETVPPLRQRSHVVQFLRFWITQARELSVVQEPRHWTWQRWG